MPVRRASSASISRASKQTANNAKVGGISYGNRYGSVFASQWNRITHSASTTTFVSTGQSGTEVGRTYRLDIFSATSQIVVNSNLLPFDVLLVGGGGGAAGGGGNVAQGFRGGSGGGGGVIQQNNVNLVSGSITVTVGGGGSGGSPNCCGVNSGSNGGTTSITQLNLSATGGGGGGSSGSSGASGGGGGWVGGSGGPGGGTAYLGHDGQPGPFAQGNWGNGGGAGAYEASTTHTVGSRSIDMGNGAVSYSPGNTAGLVGGGGAQTGYYDPTPGNPGAAGRVIIRYRIA